MLLAVSERSRGTSMTRDMDLGFSYKVFCCATMLFLLLLMAGGMTSLLGTVVASSCYSFYHFDLRDFGIVFCFATSSEVRDRIMCNT